MKRSTLIGALAGAALLLVGCGSASGTASPVSTTSVSTTSSATVSSESSSSAVSSSSAPASAEVSSSTAASPPSSGGSAPESVTESSGPSSSQPDVTVGDTSGGLDEQSTAWFTAFCDGMGPVVQLSSSLSSAGGAATTEAGEKKIITLFTTMGTSMTTTAAALKGLPAPTFSGGAAFASKVITAFGTAGPVITAQAKKISADPSTFAKSMGDLTSSLTKASEPLQDLGSLKLTPQTEAALLKIPACKKVQALAGG